MLVPAPVVAAVAAAGLGAIEGATPAGAGRRNDVWLVGLAAGRDVVVRLLADAARLAMEQAVIARVAAEGVPVAEVLWAAADPVPVMVQRRLPGRRLSDVEATDALGAALASTMRAIHAIPIAGGFGTLTAELRGEDDRLTSWFTERVRAEVEALAPGASADDRRRLEAGLAVLEDAGPLLDAQPGGLAHGDVQPSNVLVHGEKVTGVLDWEAAKSGPPAFDLGWWDWFSAAFATPWPTECLLEHYDADRRLDRDELRQVRSLVVHRIWLRELVAALRRGDRARADAARQGLGLG